MAISITIDGVTKTDAIEWKTLRKSETLTKEPDTLEFNIKNYGTKTYQPDLNDEVILLDGSDKVFGGVIVEMNEVMSGGLAKTLQVICKDYTEILDRQLVSKTYQAMTVNDIIADLLSTFATGFTDTNVACTVVIDDISFNYLTISKCLAKLTEGLGNYEWYVDYDKDIHFFESASISSPFNLTDTSANFVFGSLQLSDQTHQIRNEIIVRGGEVESASSRTEYFSGDGTITQWALANKFSGLPTVTVGGVSKTVGVDFLNDDASYQFMWDYNAQSLRSTAGNTPASGTRNIVVTGYPLYPLIVIKREETSIATYGLHQYLVIDKNIKSLDLALKRATAEILQYSVPSKTGAFRTYTGGLRAGQSINITSTIRGIDQNYKIRQISTTFHTPTAFAYDVQIETANDIGIQDVLSQLLIKNPSDQITIGQGEVVQRFYGFSETADVSDTLATPTKTSPPYVYGTAVCGFCTCS